MHEHLPPQARRELKEVGWTKGLELAKLARRDRQRFDCATWLHKPREMPKEQFKQEVEKELTRRETEPWEIIYFKLYKSQIPVVEQAIKTAALMLGTDKSRGYCLEMISADFLAGANLNSGRFECALVFDPAAVQVPSGRGKKSFSRSRNRESFVNGLGPKRERLRLNPDLYDQLRNQMLRRDGWRCQSCGTMSNLEVHHKEFRGRSGDDSGQNLITLCVACHDRVHRP